MRKEIVVPLFDVVACLSQAMDLISPRVVNHHHRVAYFASSIAMESGLAHIELESIILAGLLHDAGAISLKNRLDTLNFEIKSPHVHAERGYLFLNSFAPFATIARLVRHHHVPWEWGRGVKFEGEQVLAGSHILHLADRIDALIDMDRTILGQVKKICRTIKEHSGQEFKPDLVDLFVNLAKKEYFWLDALSDSVGTILAERSAKSASTIVNMENLEGVAGLFSRIIDFRSRYTSVHSAGVAAIAEYLARASGLPEDTCRQVRIAGYLHDLGKLSVPKEILEKPSRLSAKDFSIMKAHTFHTYRILERIKGFGNIRAWAAFHHERADGSGYPFHVKGRKYSNCCRIMSVADIFTALTEDRPYRKGMNIEHALDVLAKMAENGKLDGRVVTQVREHQKELMTLRNAAQSEALKEYDRLERLLLLDRSET